MKKQAALFISLIVLFVFTGSAGSQEGAPGKGDEKTASLKNYFPAARSIDPKMEEELYRMLGMGGLALIRRKK